MWESALKSRLEASGSQTWDRRLFWGTCLKCRSQVLPSGMLIPQGEGVAWPSAGSPAHDLTGVGAGLCLWDPGLNDLAPVHILRAVSGLPP